MKDVKEIERVLKALGNKRRLGIIRYLNNKSQASVGDIAEEIKLSVKSTSRHLAVLFVVDLVDREQVHTTVFYRLAKPPSPIFKTTLSIL